MYRTIKRYYVVLLLIFVISSCSAEEENNTNYKSGQSTVETGSSYVSSGGKKVKGQEQVSEQQNDSLKKEEIGEKKVSEEKTIENKSSYKVTFVELGSVNCIPCRMMQPIMKEIEEEYKNHVKVVFHDVWTKEGNPYAAKYKIRVIPTQVFLDKNGKEYFRHEGFFPKEELVKILKMQRVE